MWEWAKKFLTDETAFIGAVRAVLLGLGGMVIASPESVPMLPEWVGPIALMAGGFIRAGDKNPGNGQK